MSVFKIGIYGKLPAHPDFISSEVEASVTSELYEWAQRVIHDSQNDLGDDWLSAYLVSPLWRFLLSSSPQRKTGLVGVMTPSVDAVGRYFPLFLFIEIELKRVRSAWLFQEISPLLKLLEETAILSLQKRLDIKQLKEHIAEKSIGFEPGEVTTEPASLLNFQSLVNPLSELQLEKLEHSLWWSFMEIGDISEPCCVLNNLPSEREYGFLLTGATALLEEKD